MSSAIGWSRSAPDVHTFLSTLALINMVLLIFNLLPIYPLDGGQILRSVLWFWLGRARSLMVASAVGMVGVAGLFLFSYWTHSLWNAAIAAFVLIYCWDGLQKARSLSRAASAPRREGFACPSCNAAPRLGPYWLCSRCEKAFDTFEGGAVCPHCQTRFPKTSCLECGAANPFSAWTTSATAGPSGTAASQAIPQSAD
jgi:hypothetical protein